jgi:hypothetical protein
MNNKLFILLPLLLIASGSQAQDIATALKACSGEENSLKRLICFDHIVKDINQYEVAKIPYSATAKVVSKAMPAAATVSKQSAVSAAAASEPLPTKQKSVDQAEADFGLEHKKAAELTEDRLYAQVSSISKDPYKNLIITLVNGQVWQQTEALYFKMEVNDTIYIERGALSSFFLGRDDNNRRIRVKRIK